MIEKDEQGSAVFTIMLAQALAVGILGIVGQQRIERLFHISHLARRGIGRDGQAVFTQSYRAVEQRLQAIPPGAAAGVQHILQVTDLMGQADVQRLRRMAALSRAEMTDPDAGGEPGPSPSQ